MRKISERLKLLEEYYEYAQKSLEQDISQIVGVEIKFEKPKDLK